jgi:outer membrane protein assembly factor BamA
VKPFLLTSLLVLAIGSPLEGAAQLRGPEIEAVRYEGNATFPADSLSRAIVTQETACRSAVLKFPIPFCGLGVGFSLRRSYLRDRDLPRDQTRLMIWYQRRGFLEVQVASPEVVSVREEVEVLFRIVEGRPVLADTISFLGVDGLEETGLLDNLPLRQGDRLSTLALDATSDSIRRRLNNQGFAYGDVFRRAFRPDDDPYNAQVTFEIVRGPPTTYGAINITGLDALTVGTVRRTLQFNSGDRYREVDIRDAGARLRGLEIVRNARVVPAIGETPQSVVDVNVEVSEGDAYRVRAGGGWSTAECLNVEARWSSRNFLGGGRVLQVRGRLGNLLASDFRDVLWCTQSGEGQFAQPTWLAAVDLVQPWIFSTRNSLTASVFAERQSLPDVFIRRAVGIQLRLVRSLRPETTLALFYRPELSELDADDALFCTGFLVCSPSDIEGLEGANWLSPIGVTIAEDRSDDLLDPRTGSRLLLEVEHAAPWTASDFRYDRLVAEASWYSSLSESTVFATRLRGGWVGSGGFEGVVQASEDVEIVHPQKRFYAGGANSVRGFAQSRLGPRVLVSDPVDLLSPVENDGAGCAPQALVDLSCDAGAMADQQFNPRPTGGTRVLEANAEVRFRLASWLEGVTFTDVGQAWGTDVPMAFSDLEFAPGVGVRFPSPVGPIRIDVAYRFRGGEDLPVVTPQIRAFDPDTDTMADWLTVDGQEIPWVLTNDLALLNPLVLFGEDEGRLQFHLSIGQAF